MAEEGGESELVASLKAECEALRETVAQLQEKHTSLAQISEERARENIALRDDLLRERQLRVEAEADEEEQAKLEQSLKSAVEHVRALTNEVLCQRKDVKTFLKAKDLDLRKYLRRHGEELRGYQRKSQDLEIKNLRLGEELEEAREIQAAFEKQIASTQETSRVAGETAEMLRASLQRSEAALNVTTIQLEKTTAMIATGQFGGPQAGLHAAASHVSWDATDMQESVEKLIGHLRSALVANRETEWQQESFETRVAELQQQLERSKSEYAEAKAQQQLLARESRMSKIALARVSKASKEELRKMRLKLLSMADGKSGRDDGDAMA